MNDSRSNRSGLCTTCNSADACMYLARQHAPIWRCEEFDDGTPARVALTVRRAPDPAPVAFPPGLCANCENLKTCLLPKRRLGVWHCEEYQ